MNKDSLWERSGLYWVKKGFKSLKVSGGVTVVEHGSPLGGVVVEIFKGNISLSCFNKI